MEERSSFGRWLLFGAIGVALFFFGRKYLFGSGDAPTTQPLGKDDWGTIAEGDRPEPETCTLSDDRSALTFSTRGAALTSARMLEPKYATAVDAQDTRIDLVSTAKEQRMPLRTSLRSPSAEANQVELDNLDFKLVASDAATCTFAFEDASSSVVRTYAKNGRPFEVDVTTTVKNKAGEPRKHRFAIEQTSWRKGTETESSFWDLGRRPEWMTEVLTHTDKGTERHLPPAFAPDEFTAENGFTDEHFLRAEGTGRFAAVGANYFVSVVMHTVGPAPVAETLIEDGHYYQVPSGHAQYGHMYRARLAYPEATLAPGEEATYRAIAFMGPKERPVLAAVGGTGGEVSAVVDLGMFGALGKIFLWYVDLLFGLVKSWGWAICLLTITVKLVVFPLQLPQLRTTVAMRRVKPQMDAINEKYADDMMQKNVALQELYRKEGIRPALGCLPLLLQMPVWIALYQALSTEVGLYHTAFGPLIPDLTHADPYHIIPFILGGSSFLQQRMMPPQGMDPAQQKMMLYLMPGIFTAMMFFLPAGLGVYMLTNTWLGIIQQFLVERWVQSKVAAPARIEVREVDEDTASKPAMKGKGKRARG
jgi:YidC/Oxa1 family membrane protein insertase